MFVGEMEVNPDTLPNDGSQAEVTVWVYRPGSPRQPVSGLELELYSSRGDLDTISVPSNITDPTGKIVGFVSSETVGEASLGVRFGSEKKTADVCESILGSKCSPPLHVTVTFISKCEPLGLKECDGECVDTDTNSSHCGRCGNACSPGTACGNGECGCVDLDGDTAGDVSCGGNDCNDNDDTIYGGAPERCDLKDNDCDDETDELPDATNWCAQQEGDCCNGIETCQNGTCQPAAAALDCNDNEVCTDDSCDSTACCSAADCCVHTPRTGVCDDGDPFTHTDRCAAGVCTGTPYTCDDGDPCTDDVPDGQGNCSYPFNAGPCDDGDDCTHTDTCEITSGNCVGTAYSCDDSDVCTNDICDGQGGCSHPFNSSPCDDEVACTSPTSTPDPNDTCDDQTGICRGVPDHAYCDDNNECTDDYCDMVNGCVHTPNTLPCDDGIACSVIDTCDGMGRCYGTAEDALCDDGNVCTEGNCVLTVGCVFTGQEGPCDDGVNCTYPDTCIGTSCVGTNRVILPIAQGGCEDSNPCTIDSCEEATGNCQYAARDCSSLNGPCVTGVCNTSDGTCRADPKTDGTVCTLPTTPPCTGECISGACICGCTSDAECADTNPCTIDTCVSFECQYADNIGAACDDSVGCTDDQCIANGICQGTPDDTACDDSSPCTVDTCDAINDCQYTSNVGLDSAVYTSSACLTRGASGRSTVFVDLVDKDGNPLSGATLTFTATGAAVTWVEGAVTESTALPGTYYRTLVAPDTGAGTTVSIGVTCDSITETLNQTVTVTFAEPHAGSGGTGGCSPADGNLRVKVIAKETGNPIQNANVIIGLAQGTPFITSVETFLASGAPSVSNLAVTDAQGYAYFLDLGSALDGNLTVTAGQPAGAASDRAYFTFDRVQASDLVIPLKLSSPQVPTVSFTNSVASGNNITTGINDVQGGLVFGEMSLNDLTVMATEDLIAKNHCITLPAGLGEMAFPENMFVPAQEVLVPGVFMDVAFWDLTFKQGSRLNMVYGAIDANQILNIPCDMGEILAAFELAPVATYQGAIGFAPSTDTGADTGGYSIAMQAQYPRTLTITTVNRPAWTDLLGLVMGDYDGSDGSGRIYLNGMKLIKYSDASPNTAVVAFAADSTGANVPLNPDPAVARYFGAAVAMSFDPITARPLNERPDPTQGKGVSTVLWRDNGSGGAPFSGAADATWTVNSFLEIAKAKIGANNKNFVWDNVAANGTTPELSVHEMIRVTDQYRDPESCETEVNVESTTKDLYWEVWRPYATSCNDTTGSETTPNPKECFTLPSLPATWPRAGTDVATGKDDGFSTRIGSGTPCGQDSDCQITGDWCMLFGARCDLGRHRECSLDSDCDSCIAGDVCNQIDQVCISGMGSMQRNVWMLRVGSLNVGSFNFNRFALDDRRAYLTHESSNRLMFNQ